MRTLSILTLTLLVGGAACTKADKPEAKAEAKTSEAKTSEAKPGAAPASVAATPAKVGKPIAADAQVVAIAALVKDPASFKGKPFVTTGTVTAVCQEMGCWMEIKDDATEAHIKMAGESFFVPKSSAGHKARVQGTLVEEATADGVECNKEAAEQMGKQVAKLQLEATGVEID